jgi:hypothetical protein
MNEDFDINDPEFWQSIDWDADKKGPVIKSDSSVRKSDANRNRWKNPNYREQRIKSIRELARDPIWLANSTSASQRTALTDEWKIAVAEGRKAFKNNPVKYQAFLEKLRESFRKRLAENPDVLLPLHTASREYHALESTKQAKSERMLNQWSDAEYAAKMKKMRDELAQDPEHIEKLRMAQSHRCVAVVTPFGEYERGAEFEREYPIKLRDRLLQMPHLYYRKEDGPGEPTYETVYITEFGEFPSMRTAHEHAVELGLSESTADVKRWWKKVSKNKSKFYTQKQKRREWGARKHKKKRI